jgi:predicted esterase
MATSPKRYDMVPILERADFLFPDESILILHGDQDNVLDVRHVGILYEALRGKGSVFVRVLKDKGHLLYEGDKGETARIITEFLDSRSFPSHKL